MSELSNLEFEDLEVSHGKNHEVDDSKNKAEDQVLIDYSSNVVAALRELMKAHNKDSENNKVSLRELKQVFRRGANCLQAEEVEVPCGVLALARVNMFLRLKSGEIMQASRSKTNSFDISDSWYPNESDFTKKVKER